MRCSRHHHSPRLLQSEPSLISLSEALMPSTTSRKCLCHSEVLDKLILMCLHNMSCSTVCKFPSQPSVDVSTVNKAIQQAHRLFKEIQSENRKPTATPSTTVNHSKKVRKREDGENSLLKFLALNALELTAPASDVLLRQNKTVNNNVTLGSNSWFQLSGHPDAFAPAGPGTIWKKCSGGTEKAVYEAISSEPVLRGVTPHYLREVQYAGQTFIELEDLLHSFKDPNVMDIKMGTRTFLEDEVENSSEREDLYRKMIAVDPSAPSAEEHAKKAVTKLRYMQFREQQSSTCSLGFRIEAMKFRGSPPVTDLKRVKSSEDVLDTMSLFLGNREDARQRIVARLTDIRNKLEQSKYFKQHEVVGSSILILYDDSKVGAWLIDFAKTRPVPEGIAVNHRSSWSPGNHEEGFLFGLDQLIRSMEKVKTSGGMNAVTSTTPVALKS